jgi:hypothetical protein
MKGTADGLEPLPEVVLLGADELVPRPRPRQLAMLKKTSMFP